MELKGSKTEGLLRQSFDNEIHAYFKYIYAASAARKAGLQPLAEIFYETAQNEAEHAKHEFNFLGGIGDIGSVLENTIHNEHKESAHLYPDAAKVAAEEGFTEISDFFFRMSKVEQRHEKKFREMLDNIDNVDALEGKTVSHSAVKMAQIMLPDQANPSGYVHGGELMKLMDNAAGVAAIRHSRLNVVTALVDELHFLKPVRVGDLVLLYSRLTFVSYSSMEVRVEVDREDLFTGEKVRALTAYYIMTALDKNEKPTKVPPLLIFTEEEEKFFNDGMVRYQMRKKKSAELKEKLKKQVEKDHDFQPV